MHDSKYTICVDFDGVIHSYSRPFSEKHLDPPVPGALDWLRAMNKSFKITVLSTRAGLPFGPERMREWFRDHDLEESVISELSISDKKCPALIYLDDRAVRFTGDNWPTEQEIHNLKPWNKDAS